MKKGVQVFWGAIVVVILLALGSSFFVSSRPGQYDQLAQCIKSQGVVFYGAYWCPHCQRTKAMFGSSAKLLPYVECSKSDGKTQTDICIEKKIVSYPTWIRPDGASMNGEHTMQEWASFSGCTIDGQKTAFSAAATSSAEASPAKQ